MRYLALASDYDGTLAKDGVVSPETLEGLERLRDSGRRLALVTGRELADLETVFSRLDLFDCVVAENGAVLYWPEGGQKRVLTEPPKASFIGELKQRGVRPLSVGDAIVATVRPNETVVLEVIRDLGLELQIVFNKRSVMILPSGINKMTGLRQVLEDWGLPEREVVGVGDAENDHAFLKHCGYSVAVANALPALKETANMTTRGDHGAGVIELIDMILRDDRM